MLKSGKAALAAMILMAAVCIGLGVFSVKSYRQLSRKDQQIQQLTAESKAHLDKVEALTRENQTLARTLVPKEEYARVIGGILMLKNTAVASGLLPDSLPAMRPEQMCEVIKPLLQGGSASASNTPAAEMDFHRRVVEKEIATWSVIDTKDTDKNAVCLYHLQKVMDSIGYGLGGQIKTTAEAVMKFQTDNGLKADGKIGAKTWAKILQQTQSR